MDIRKVKKLIELLEESGIAEIEIKEGEESVRISRGSSITPSVPPQQPVYVAQTATPTATVESLATTEPEATTAHPRGEAVESPMVGTFYSAASPDDAPFVTVGKQVNVGDTLCIIEAMKIMNHIESDVVGTVVSVERQNGDAVEFGDPLFIIEP